jgi:CRISPR/Cas system CSM-associated protein Csm3 (group 7 of RAMP superfamily)
MAQWSAEASREIVYRVVAEGQLVLETPTHFGTGAQTGTELIILQDEVDGSPLLPGASQAGALRHYLLRREKGYHVADDSSKTQKTFATQLFGEALDKDRGEQSRIITYDAHGTVGILGIRDGVKIDGQYRSADEGALFSVQVWPEGTTFELHIELYICEGDDADKLKQAFAVLLQAISDGEIPLGARKHRGYGRCRVATWQVYEYDLIRPDGFLAWVMGKPTADTAANFLKKADGFADNRERVKLSATFALCDSLMIRSSAELVDNVHLKNAKGEPVLSGTSITGALRARALKIAKTSFKSDAEGEALVDDMFGLHGDKAKTGKQLTASRIHIEETTVTAADMTHIQNRVKIDRFTGGAYETALISEQPAFATQQTQVKIKLELQYPANDGEQVNVRQQTGLLLLLLKDLWTEDLPLGGESSTGRGRLKGVSGQLMIGNANSPEIYEFNERGLENPNQAYKLQTYVDELWGQA